MLDDIREFVNQYWLWIVIGLVLTEKAVSAAYAQRGYLTVGGEWLVLPVIILAVSLIRSVIEDMCDIWERDDDDDWE